MTYMSADSTVAQAARLHTWWPSVNVRLAGQHTAARTLPGVATRVLQTDNRYC